jgi:hypothetical protein
VVVMSVAAPIILAGFLGLGVWIVMWNRQG